MTSVRKVGQLPKSCISATLLRLFALQPLRSRTLLRPDSSDPIRQRGVQGRVLAITLKRKTNGAKGEELNPAAVGKSGKNFSLRRDIERYFRFLLAGSKYLICQHFLTISSGCDGGIPSGPSRAILMFLPFDISQVDK